MSASHPETVIGLFADRASQFGERPFVSLVRPNRIETMSYAAAAARVVGIAEKLLGLGYRKGDRIAAFLDEGEPGLWFYLACGALGVIPVPLGPSYSVDALWQLVAQSEAKAVFTTAERVGLLQGKAPILSAAEGGAVDGATVLSPAPVPAPLDRLRELAAAITPDDLFMLQPTSGSTGVPKLVMRRNITFPRSGRVIAAGLAPGSPEAGLLAQALTHGGGHYCLNVALYLGGQLCIPSAIDTAISLDEVEAMAPTFLYVAPRILRSFYQQHLGKHGQAATPFCGGRLRWVFVGGGVPDEEILSWVEQRGVQVLEGYGATEVSMVAMTERGRRKAGSAGRLLDDVEVRIADDGEIRVKTRFGMAGYLHNEALTRDAFDEHGYYMTGDLGRIDDGALQLQGRKRDVFNSSEGSNIYPVRIEEMIESLPWVEQVMLVGDMKPFIVALIVPKQPGDAQALYSVAAADLARINERVERFERIKRFSLLPARFDETIYRVVGQAKVRRDRKAMLVRHAELIATMYGPKVDVRMEVLA